METNYFQGLSRAPEGSLIIQRQLMGPKKSWRIPKCMKELVGFWWNQITSTPIWKDPYLTGFSYCSYRNIMIDDKGGGGPE